MDDLISRQAAIDAIGSYILSFTAIDCNYYEGLRDAKKLLNDIPSAESEQRWIPISERLPDNGEDVLCYFKDNDYGVNHIIDDEDGEWFYNGVVAWIPLPEPYKEAKE